MNNEVNRIKIGTLSKLCIYYVYLMLIYLCFETLILNVVPSSMVIIIRYGVELIGYILLLFLIITKRKRFKVSKFGKLLILLVAIMVISIVINSVRIKIAVLGSRWIIRYLYIFLICYLARWDIKDIDKFFRIIKVIMVVEIILSILQMINRESMDAFLLPHYESLIDGISGYSLQGQSRYAIFASFGRYGEFAYFIMFALWIWFADYLCADNPKSKRLSKIMLFVWFILLIFSYGRQELIAVIVSVLFFALKYKEKVLNKYQKTLIMIGIIILIPTAFVFSSNFTMGYGVISEGIAKRFLSIFSTDYIKSDFLGYGRTWYYTVGLFRLLSKKPLFGFGVGMYGCQTAITYDQSVHIALGIPATFSMDVYYVSIIGQVGLVGVIALLSIYTKMVRDGASFFNGSCNNIVIQKLSIITFGVVICGLVTGFFSSSLSDRYLAFFIWSIAGVFERYKNINDASRFSEK